MKHKYIPLFILFFLKFSTQTTELDIKFVQAVDNIFSIQSGLSPTSQNELCMKNIKDMFLRQEIPWTANEIRNSSDEFILKIAILATYSSFSSWKKTDSGKIIINQYGFPVKSTSILETEIDVLLCIICALMTVLATSHLLFLVDTKNVNTTPQPTKT